jgi:hypothetical protein
MSRTIEYHGYIIEPITRRKGTAPKWTLAVRIAPAGRRTGGRRCRAPNTYATEELAVKNCFEFGRQIVDGKLHPRRTA